MRYTLSELEYIYLMDPDSDITLNSVAVQTKTLHRRAGSTPAAVAASALGRDVYGV